MNRCIRFSLWFASVSFLLLVVSTNSFIPNTNVSRFHRGRSNLLLFSTNEGQQTPVQKKQEQIMEMASIAGAEVSVYLNMHILPNAYIIKYIINVMEDV